MAARFIWRRTKSHGGSCNRYQEGHWHVQLTSEYGVADRINSVTDGLDGLHDRELDTIISPAWAETVPVFSKSATGAVEKCTHHPSARSKLGALSSWLDNNRYAI